MKEKLRRKTDWFLTVWTGNSIPLDYESFLLQGKLHSKRNQDQEGNKEGRKERKKGGKKERKKEEQRRRSHRVNK